MDVGSAGFRYESAYCEFSAWTEPVQMWRRVASCDGFDIFHRHIEIELNRCEEGRGFYWVQGYRREMVPGVYTLLWSPYPHRVFAIAGHTYCRTVLQFPLDLVAEALREAVLPSPTRSLVQLSLPDRLHSEADYLLGKVLRETQGHRPYARDALSIYVSELMLLLTRSRVADPSPQHTPHEEHVVAVLQQMVESWIARNFTIQDLAKEIGLSAGHLRRLFRKVEGVSLGTYVQQRRVERARHLLKQGYRVTDAAFECGFTDVSSFSKSFRRNVGMCPSQFQDDAG